MRVVQRIGHRGDDFGGIPYGWSSLSNPDREIAAFEKLRHHEAESVFGATDVEHGHDIGMIQLGEDTGFGEKRIHMFRVGDSRRAWNLDRDRTVEVIVVSEIHPSKPTLTQTALLMTR